MAEKTELTTPEKIEALIADGYDIITISKTTGIKLSVFFHYTSHKYMNHEENAIDHLYYSVFGEDDGEE